MKPSPKASSPSKRLRQIIAWLALSCAVLTWPIPIRRGMCYDERNIEKYATRRVQPAYPPNAQKYRIEGTVTIKVQIGGDGKVIQADFIRGHNVFRSVSLDAAKRWEFRLPSNDGNQGTVQFTFKSGN